MKNENKAVLELCKFISPNREEIEILLSQPLDFPYILGQLLYNRMGGAAYYSLKKCGLLGRVNREFRNTLKTVYDSGVTKYESFQTALESFSEMLCRNALRRDGFSYAMLKGAYLVSLYPAGLRISNDLDILVDQISLPKLETALKDNGYEQGYIQNGSFVPAARSEILSSRMNRGETVPFIKKVDLPQMEYFEIDINFSLDFKAKQESDNVSLLLQNAAPMIETNAGELLTLSPSDFLIHLCAHLFKEAAVYAWVQMERDLSLYKFADLYLVLNEWQSVIFFDALETRIQSLGMRRECYFALLFTKELFGLESEPLDKLLSAIKPESTDYLKEILRPEQNKLYRHNKSFTDWMFTSARKTHLEELSSATAEPWMKKFNRLR